MILLAKLNFSFSFVKEKKDEQEKTSDMVDMVYNDHRKSITRPDDLMI